MQDFMHNKMEIQIGNNMIAEEVTHYSAFLNISNVFTYLYRIRKQKAW